MIQPPKKLTGPSPLVAWLNQLRDFAITHSVISAPNAIVSRTTRGTVLKPGGGGKGGAAPGMRLRGEFSSVTAYDEGDVVRITGGVAAGTYVAMSAVAPGSDPSQGSPWFQIAGGIHQELWQ